MRRKRRVRVHLRDDSLPTVEGLLVSRGAREYTVAVPSLLPAADAAPLELAARWLVIPREQVAFYEVLT